MGVELQTVLIFAMMTSLLGWRPFNVKILNETLEILHPEIMDVNLTLKNQSFIDVHVNIVHDITQLFLDMQLNLDSGDGNYNMVYMNRTVDVCMFLNNRKTNPILDITYRILTANGDLPKKCPMRKGCYKLLNAFFDPEKFPPFMPDHKVRATGFMWNKVNGKKNILMFFRIYGVMERAFKSG